MKINIHLDDSLKAMESMSDKKYGLAFCDPNYGIGASKPSKKPNKAKQRNGNILNVKTIEYKHSDWDNKPADPAYFKKIFRVSKNQIIWGVNYYNYPLPGGRVVWDKLNGDSDQYDCEIAYNSYNKRTDIVYYMWAGMFQGLRVSKNYNDANEQIGDKSFNEKRIHECQKPVKLYSWFLKEYVKPGTKILETHGGSFSIVISCIDLGYDIDIYEIDEIKYNAGLNRVKRHLAQLDLTREPVEINIK